MKTRQKNTKEQPSRNREDRGAEAPRGLKPALQAGCGFITFRGPPGHGYSLTVAVSFVLQDAKHALRLWARHPWQTAFAIVALAIGSGANTGVFSVVNALLLRSLPFRDAGRLVSLETYLIPHDSAQQFHAWRQSSGYLADAALVEGIDGNLGDSRALVRGRVAQTSWNFFALLGVRPVLGRAFSSGEDTAGRNAVAVIGYGLWQQLFAGSPRALGARIRLNGAPLTVIGVTPPGFDFPAHAMLWKAAAYSPGNNGWQTVARLKAGVPWGQARAAFEAEAERLGPNRSRLERTRYPAKMLSLRDELAGPVKNASLLLLAAVVFILLIACANVANLLLARMADRRAELAIRSALGATRARIMQQVLTECLLLSLTAAAAGSGVAVWTASLAAKVQPSPLPAQQISLDWRVCGFASVVAVASGVLFGVFPSLLAGRAWPWGAWGAAGHRSARPMRETCIALQVMLTLILLTAALSTGRAFLHLLHADRGFATKDLVTASVALQGTKHDPASAQLPYMEEVLTHLRALPGVNHASATWFLPIDGDDSVGGRFGLDGRAGRQTAAFIPVLASYFATMGGRVLYGREFNDAEVRADAKVAVVNEAFARQFGSPADMLSHQVTLSGEPARRIIGVVKGMDYMSANANGNQVFVPAHSAGGFSLTFVARTNGSAERYRPALRAAIQTVDRQVPVFHVETMEQRLDGALARPAFYRTAFGFFAGFACLLAVIGIYGVVAYAVARRRRELGLRVALGATPVRLRAGLLGQGVRPVAAGAIAGSFGAAFSGRFLGLLVPEAKPPDAASLLLASLSILLVASASSWAATRQLARLQVNDVLRLE